MAEALPDPLRQPPSGVPRWLWPPPGAVVRRVVIREESTASGPRFHVVAGEPAEAQHLRALQWLVGDFPRDEAPPAPPAVSDVLLEIARTEMRGGRVGHAFALNGHALGAPGNQAARGVLWRYAAAVLGRAPEPPAPWRVDDF